MNDFGVIRTFKNFDLIKIDDFNFCVRKRYKSFFGKVKETYMCLNRVGTEFTMDSLTKPITVSDLESAEYVWKCNVIKHGYI